MCMRPLLEALRDSSAGPRPYPSLAKPSSGGGTEMHKQSLILLSRCGTLEVILSLGFIN